MTDLPRLAVVCGSLQAASTNRAALTVVREVLDARLSETVEADIASIPLFNPENGDDPGPAVERLRTVFDRADIVVVASPEYAGGVPGALKNAFDWIVGSGELYGKPMAIISSGTSGGQHARTSLIRTLTWQGAHIVGHLGIASPMTKMVDGRITHAETLTAIQSLANVLTSVASMTDDERLALVTRITREAGVEDGHVAPMQG